jgi:hypothetical protein
MGFLTLLRIATVIWCYHITNDIHTILSIGFSINQNSSKVNLLMCGAYQFGILIFVAILIALHLYLVCWFLNETDTGIQPGCQKFMAYILGFFVAGPLYYVVQTINFTNIYVQGTLYKESKIELENLSNFRRQFSRSLTMNSHGAFNASMNSVMTDRDDFYKKYL